MFDSRYWMTWSVFGLDLEDTANNVSRTHVVDNIFPNESAHTLQTRKPPTLHGCVSMATQLLRPQAY